MTQIKTLMYQYLLALIVCLMLVACGGGSVDSLDKAPDDGDDGSENSTPTLTIISPEANQSFSDQSVITFSATASDTEDGDIGSDIEWNSNLDGVIGSGSEFSASLSSGEHTVTASVTDSDNASSSDSIELTIRISQGFATINWVPPSLNTDGSNLNDLAGYKIELGQSEDNLNQYQIVNGSSSSSLLENLIVGETYYYAVRAINQYGIESQLSAVSSFRVVE
ncbi:Ig-like domain-containing protein [Pleionea mediterranea]|uniref:Fibronectin type III domain protein n=1 Tax=Pleionea mediterranea TaxID=523701 RepID=A0A316FZY2_9GAMM|nr:fibronectin type III domain-containing protein [Pleionea mediterranea]PWK53695.1 fibronectin type III domain protein [Pleionea mediterranea]